MVVVVIAGLVYVGSSRNSGGAIGSQAAGPTSGPDRSEAAIPSPWAEGPTPAATLQSLPTPISPTWTSGPGWFTYRVLPGDTMSKIAGKFNLQLWELELANPQITNFNRLLVGQLLYIPPPGQVTEPPTTPVPS
jgi:hypothetical protein